MTLIRQYVNAMRTGDSVALSKLFSPDAIFVDYCPKDAGQAQISAYGPEAIDMFFRNRFIFRRFKIFDPVIVRLSYAGSGDHSGLQWRRRDPAHGGPSRIGD